MFAHSIPDKPEDEWEGLQQHLSNVAGKAKELATPFGGQTLAFASGLLHDIGKVDPNFQARLRGDSVRVDHARAGATIAIERYGRGIGKMLAYGIAGHHTGLANGSRQGGGTTPLNDRLAGAENTEIPCWMTDLPTREVALSKATAPKPMLIPGFDMVFSLPFLTRMIFSTLVDADYLETERFYAGAKGYEVDRGSLIPMQEVHDRLVCHMQEKQAKSADTPINRLRNEVLRAAIDRAELAPGLFSLTVPTGGGKTLTSAAFATSHAVTHGQRRIIYVIPYTSIIEQTADVLRAAMGADAVLEHHSAFDGDGAMASGRDKLRRAAENWDYPVVVTTAVQFFESLFANRPSRCRKLHAIANSVVVIDEAQTLPLNLLRPCMEVLRELARGYGVSVVLCTATQPALRQEDGFAGGFRDVREIAPDPVGLYQKLKRVNVQTIADPLTDDDLRQRIADLDQVMVILNNRRHARELYEQIADQPGARHLSTWMCAAHRRAVLAGLRDDLTHRKPVKLVSTSLVEAGVDIDFPTVYRAIAGIDSVAQAAGRCNREGKMDGLGQVYVFTPADVDGRQPPPDLRQYAAAARDVLRQHGDDPISLDAVRMYFKRVYWMRRATELDSAMVGEGDNRQPGILKALSDYAATLDYPFADIAAAFRIIATADVPVIVPYAGVEGVLTDLRIAKTAGGIARRLQQYTVQVPRKERENMIASGVAEVIRQPDFGDQFVIIRNGNMYREDVGLII